jgi:competence ComEA-like helix-hairpin-helix protein
VQLKSARVVPRTAPIGHPGTPVAGFHGGDAVPLFFQSIGLVRSYTLELWIKPESLEPATVLLYGSAAQPKLQVALEGSTGAEKRGLTIKSGTEDQTFDLLGPFGHRWFHLACRYDADSGHSSLFLNGKHLADMRFSAVRSGSQALHVGNRSGGPPFRGQLAELRIWNRALDAAEIDRRHRRRASGKEPGLRICLPLDDDFGADPVTNRVAGAPRPSVTAGLIRSVRSDDLPMFPGSSLVTAEYSTVGRDPKDAQASRALLRRFYCFADDVGKVALLPGKRIEELVLKWIGNAQFEPTLLGFMEGAPPVPSENLTIDYDYDGATTVELTMSDEIEYSWNRSTDVGGGLDINAFLGVGWGVAGGIGIETKISEGQAGLRAIANTDWRREANTNIRARSTSTARDQLELRGAFELEPIFPHLGKRYVPKNVGYALVISGMADVFITQTKRTGRMVAYEVTPCEDMPPDVNTITFLINPAYTLNGSLDGLVGSHAADQRFYRHVPALRAQHGSRYPASYFNIAEAYRLKQQIERWDKDRESYFAAFDSQSVMGLDEGLLDQVPDKDFEGGRLASLAENDTTPPVGEDDERSERTRSTDDTKRLRKKFEKDKEKQEAETKKRVSDIERRFAGSDEQQEATSAFETWQRRMESLQLRASKRNIQNTYVWDADGGMRFEEESFANTIEHTIGGSFHLDASLGADINAQISAFKGELQAMANLTMSQTMTKSRSSTRSFELNVRLDRVERKGITGADDLPVHPGEKVDRYRFMSFYLEGDTNHFHDFFGRVVDPEWLRSNDEEARALRQIAQGRPNKTWRVLHRVTYVERPALMGFGRDLRQADDLERASREVHNYFDSLEQDNAELRNQLSAMSGQLKAIQEALRALTSPAAPQAGTDAAGSMPQVPATNQKAAPDTTGSDAGAPDDGSPPTAQSTANGDAAEKTSELVDLNSASYEQLEALVGIGPSMARAILDYRTANNGFASVIELVNISGIGTVLLQRLRPQIKPIGEGESQ